MPSSAETSLVARLDYTFRDPVLFRQALTHKSYVNENAAEGAGDNERLELLGDAVLDLVITELIMERYDELSEGQLSKLRASLVSEPTLAGVARELELGACLRMGRGEESSGGAEKNSILSDALEALLAAIYLDSKDHEGLSVIQGVVRQLFWTRITELNRSRHRGDYKTELQELAQKSLHKKATYRVLREEGPDHAKRYEVAVFIEEQELGRGQGRSKKESEQRAAHAALVEHFWTREVP